MVLAKPTNEAGEQWFLVRRPFDWGGAHYERGDRIVMPQNHPRLNGMMAGRYIVPIDTPPDGGKGKSENAS